MHLLPLLLLWFHSFGGTLNVRNYGAKGDGVTDDTQAINTALKAAHDQQADLYFPSGTYLCNQPDAYGNILTYYGDGGTALTIYGQDSTSIIKTTLNTECILFFVQSSTPCSGLTIRTLNFQRTHAATAQPCNGLFFNGTNAQCFTNLTVSNCYFYGFTLALCGQGITGWTVTRNFFGAPNGHDDVGNTSNPAVFLWCFDNGIGRCINVSITSNTADGYTGTKPMSALVTHRPMDGFIFGTGYGFTITNNTTRHFSEEHILLQPRNTYPNDSTPTLISQNYLDCSLVPGISNTDGSPHLANYGIRCDISDATISNNTIVNYTTGIIIRGVEYPTAKLHSYVITGNQLHSATDTVNYNVSAGILIQSNANPVTRVRMMDNDIYTNLPDLPNSSRSIRVQKTNTVLHSLITNNSVHLIK